MPLFKLRISITERIEKYEQGYQDTVDRHQTISGFSPTQNGERKTAEAVKQPIDRQAPEPGDSKGCAMNEKKMNNIKKQGDPAESDQRSAKSM